MIETIKDMRVQVQAGYDGHSKRFGVTRYGNGITLRCGPLALHVWRLID